MSKMQDRRESLDMTREELATKTKLTFGGIYRLETTKQIPRVDRAIKIAKALKTTASKLWG